MTDFRTLIVADRGQKANPIHLVDKTSFEDLGQDPPRRRPRAAERAPFRWKDRVRFRHPAAEGR